MKQGELSGLSQTSEISKVVVAKLSCKSNEILDWGHLRSSIPVYFVLLFYLMLPESFGAIGVLQHDPPPDEKMMIFVFKKDLTKFSPSSMGMQKLLDVKLNPVGTSLNSMGE